MSTAARCLVIGGARSGKSHWAEQRLQERSVRYVATGYSEGDPEWNDRVGQHRLRRPEHWETIETLAVADLLRSADPRPVLVDCLTLWLTRTLDSAGAWDRPAAQSAAAVRPQLLDLAEAVSAAQCEVVLVTNEVGSGIIGETASARLFADLLGELNRRVAHHCEEVVLMVAGIPVRVKALPSAAEGAP